jgi:hypothetical protein
MPHIDMWKLENSVRIRTLLVYFPAISKPPPEGLPKSFPLQAYPSNKSTCMWASYKSQNRECGVDRMPMVCYKN